MQQKDFHNILKRYLNGRASEEEKRIIDAWYDEAGKGHQAQLNASEESELKKRYWLVVSAHIIESRTTLPLPKPHKINKVARYSLGIAASVALILCAYIFMVDDQVLSKSVLSIITKEPTQNWIHLVNSQQTAQRFSLPDSSHITLEPQSGLKYLSSFNQSKREVFLEGEALFEVSHNKERPFLVHAKEVTTTVLGTSFRVSAYEKDKNITVAVRTGKVSVHTNPAEPLVMNGAEIILTPNQLLTYNKDEKTILRGIVDEPQALPSAEKIRRMRFEEAPVNEIFLAIEQVYGVDIVFDEKRFSSCALTTTISDGGIYNRLDIICKAIGAAYTFNENQIVITGPGCN